MVFKPPVKDGNLDPSLPAGQHAGHVSKRSMSITSAPSAELFTNPLPLAAGTRRSVVVEKCQVCASPDLKSVLFLGFLPPVNTMAPIGSRPEEQPAYPAEILFCPRCHLVQLGLIVDPAILFPPHYAYTSGTTKILRENFAQLYQEVMQLYPLGSRDLVVDVGSNDGTLLSNFQNGHRVCGIEPTNACKIAIEQGIPTINSFFGRAALEQALNAYGQAKLLTATNVFAHIENIHDIVECVLALLVPDGIFISESHYLLSLVETLQYDTIYHEHLRYYSLTSLKYLLESHGLEIIHARPIPAHGGSIRVYSARKGTRPVSQAVGEILRREAAALSFERLLEFKGRVAASKLGLLALLKQLKDQGSRVQGIGAPSRASTLVNHVGLDANILECVLEIKGSYKIGKYMPGTVIPVLEEGKLFTDQPEYALLFSWHIADELMPKLRSKGYRGKFILPLPEPKVL